MHWALFSGLIQEASLGMADQPKTLGPRPALARSAWHSLLSTKQVLSASNHRAQCPALTPSCTPSSSSYLLSTQPLPFQKHHPIPAQVPVTITKDTSSVYPCVCPHHPTRLTLTDPPFLCTEGNRGPGKGTGILKVTQ